MTKLEKFEYAKNVLKWTCDESGNVFRNNGKLLGSVNRQGYLKSAIWKDGKTLPVMLHQYVYYYFNNEVVSEIDHINRNRLDNNPSNLRAVTREQNQYNRNNTRGYWKTATNKYQSAIRVNKKLINLGRFCNEIDARNAYLQAKQKYHKI